MYVDHSVLIKRVPKPMLEIYIVHAIHVYDQSMTKFGLTSLFFLTGSEYSFFILYLSERREHHVGST